MPSRKNPLPSNPFEKTPIKERKKLVGRRPELAMIGGYLDLTANGGCPHIGIYGARGIGKTSLLFVSEDLAKDRSLLCLRVILNKNSVKSPGHFWHEVYSELIDRVTQAGCWGGPDGITYLELNSFMAGNMNAGKEHLYIKFPFLFAQSSGNKEELICPGTILKRDFVATLEDLKGEGIKGLVLQIDEADYLGSDQAILQQLRNLFQEKELRGATLMLAGTDKLFAQAAKEFSPMPRQIHPIQVKPFMDSEDAKEYLIRHLPEEIQDKLMPSPSQIFELHKITIGDPQEIQLYCHHMYAAVENESAKTMELSRGVLKATMADFHANATGDEVTKSAIEAIDGLTVKQMPPWLLLNHFYLDEVIKYISTMLSFRPKSKKEKKAKLIPETELQALRERIFITAKELHDIGLLVDPDRTEIIGGPPAYAYLRASFRAQKENQGDNPYGISGSLDYFSSMVDLLMHKLNASIVCADFPRGMGRRYKMNQQCVSSNEILKKLRKGNITRKYSDNYNDTQALLSVTKVGKEHETGKFFETKISFSMGPDTITTSGLWAKKGSVDALRGRIEAWIDTYNKELLEHTGVGVEGIISEATDLPNNAEAWRLLRLTSIGLPDAEMREVFGPPIWEQAVAKYQSRDISGALDILRVLIRDSDEAQHRNNLGYILLDQGQHEEAVDNFEKSLDEEYSHIPKHNLALSKALTGNKEDSIKEFEELWSNIESDRDDEDYGTAIMKILTSDLKKTTDVTKLYVDAATIMNLCVLGIKTREDAEAYLKGKYPDDYEAWLTYLPSE